MSKTTIEWATDVWNPVTGCSKVSDGCKHCYAENHWPRMERMSKKYAGRKFTDVMCHPETLEQPSRWTKPRRIFVNSMSDLFHEAVPFEFILAILAHMVTDKALNHQFMVLTKRPQRMVQFFEWMKTDDAYRVQTTRNMWFGVTVENQEAANERIPLLFKIPCAGRFISCEPLLEAVDLGFPDIDWVIVGGESGHKARPVHPDWVRSLRDQCAKYGVPFMFKQWGEWQPRRYGGEGSAEFNWCERGLPFQWMCKVGKKKSGCLLDDLEYKAFPEAMQIMR